MRLKQNIMEKKTVHFCVKRGNKTFEGYNNLQDVTKRRDATIISEDEDGNELPDNDWLLLDCNSNNIVLQGKKAITSKVGVVDWDGEYNKDIVKYIDDCTDGEFELIAKSK